MGVGFAPSPNRNKISFWVSDPARQSVRSLTRKAIRSPERRDQVLRHPSYHPGLENGVVRLLGPLPGIMLPADCAELQCGFVGQVIR